MSPEDLENEFFNFRVVQSAGNDLASHRKLFEALGYPKIKAAIIAGDISPSGNRAVAIEWVSEIELKEQKESARVAREDTDRSLRAAERSAAASEKSANMAKWAAIASFLAIVLTIAEKYGVFAGLSSWLHLLK